MPFFERDFFGGRKKHDFLLAIVRFFFYKSRIVPCDIQISENIVSPDREVVGPH